MRNDEFNKVEVTNEKQLRGIEFGKTQKSETISQKENKSPKGELNEKYVGKTIRKQTEVNVQYTNKTTVSSHGSATVTSSTTATSVAATTASVATAASVVAVTAIAVGTGISVALHDYQYNFNSFIVSSDSLSYELYVTDRNNRPDGQKYEEYRDEEENREDLVNEDDIPEEEREKEEDEDKGEPPLTLRVYNENYSYSIPTYLELVNKGSFANLEPDQMYHVSLTENRFGGETIFDKAFRTQKEETRVSEFKEFVFDKTANFINRTFDVRLDYIDDFDAFSDFVLSFIYISDEQVGSEEEGEGFTVDIPLKKTTEVQTVDLDGYEVMLSDSYKYRLTCNYYGEKKILEEGDVTFTDISGAVTEFRGLIFDKTANFDTRTFEVQLDYQDDLYYMYSFRFILTDLETEEERTYYLLQTTDVQEIAVDEVSGYDDDNMPIYPVDIVNHRMKYSFKYMIKDEEFTFVENEEFKFKNSLVSTFSGIETPYDFIAELTDGPFYLPIRFDFDDAAHIYQSFMVTIIADDAEAGYLMFEGDTVTHDWMYGSFYGPNGTPVNPAQFTGSNIQIKVAASVLNVDAEENGGPDVIEQDLYTEDHVTFTVNQNKDIYGAHIVSSTIYMGSIEIPIYPVFSGEPDDYEVKIIFECQSGNTYTCNFNLPNRGNYTYALLRECEEGFSDDQASTDFAYPVKVSMKYRLTDSTDYTTKVLYESFVFELSA